VFVCMSVSAFLVVLLGLFIVFVFIYARVCDELCLLSRTCLRVAVLESLCRALVAMSRKVITSSRVSCFRVNLESASMSWALA
jgi:hypothetical protein